jgi:hypothetical protein
MQLRWSIILPMIGFVLFAAVSYRSLPANHHEQEAPRRYYWWSSLRLDSDPRNESKALATPCPKAIPDCSNGESPNIKIVPGWLEKLLVVSALPAFLAGFAIVAGLSKLGVDEVLTFMVSMPILLFAWYYFMGWLIERLLCKRAQRKSVQSKIG